MQRPHAVIAGAGIGGLCAALCLARGGWRVSLYDKAQTLEEAGAGLQLSPNASIILQRLGLIQYLTPHAVYPEAIRIRQAKSGEALARVPLASAQARWGAPYLAAHRGDLYRVLLDAAAREPSIELNAASAVTGFSRCKGLVTAHVIGPGSHFEAAGDCLIGADGLRSTIRQALYADELIFSGQTAWRSVIDAAVVPEAMRRNEINLWLGSRAHLVHYPLRGGTVINVVAVVDDHFRPSSESFWSSPGDAGELARRFADWNEDARILLSAAPSWLKWPLADRRPLDHWVDGRVALLGDAAHPMLPFLAQGAAQAIEDAGALGELLSQEGDIEGKLRCYQARRLPRANRIQRQSRRQAFIYHLGGLPALARNAVIWSSPASRWLARFDWLYQTRGGDA